MPRKTLKKGVISVPDSPPPRPATPPPAPEPEPQPAPPPANVVPRVYGAVVFPDGWQDWQDNVATLKSLIRVRPSSCVYIEVGTCDVWNAMALAQWIRHNVRDIKDPDTVPPFYVFKYWKHVTNKKKPRLAWTGPGKSIASDTTQFWCFHTGPDVQMLKPRGVQTVQSGTILPILDEIADHTDAVDRLMVSFSPDPRHLSCEFDTLDVVNEQINQSRSFCLSSARKSRIFASYLQQRSLPELKSDKSTILQTLKGEGDGEADEKENMARALLDSVVGLDRVRTDPEHAQMVRSTMLPMIGRTITFKRRLETPPGGATETKPKKRRQATNNGIAAPCAISDELRDFMVEHCGVTVPPEGIPRTHVVRAIPAYIKKHELNTGKVVHPDEEMKVLLSEDYTDDCELTFFNMYKYINHHFLKQK